jgi:hypothetical protein
MIASPQSAGRCASPPLVLHPWSSHHTIDPSAPTQSVRRIVSNKRPGVARIRAPIEFFRLSILAGGYQGPLPNIALLENSTGINTRGGLPVPTIEGLESLPTRYHSICTPRSIKGRPDRINGHPIPHHGRPMLEAGNRIECGRLRDSFLLRVEDWHTECYNPRKKPRFDSHFLCAGPARGL